jgi:methionine synthase II (cobalamin-independent)
MLRDEPPFPADHVGSLLRPPALLEAPDRSAAGQIYDDPRSGGFEPLRFVPQGKMVVLGLVTTKRGELEPRDDLMLEVWG